MPSIRLFLSLLLMALLPFPGGCAKNSPAPSKTVITLWVSSNPYEIEWAGEVVRQWNNDHPDIQVKSQPVPEGRSSEEILMASVIARTTPDICANISPTLVEQFRRAKALVALDSYPELMTALKERVPEDSLREFVSPDSHLYQVPWKCNPILMFCNMRIFRESGAVPPGTYSEWMKAAAAITGSHKGVSMTFFDASVTWHKRFFDFYALYIAASGGHTLLDRQGMPSIDNDPALAVMSFLSENFRRGFAPLEITPGDPFLNERVAVNISGPWNVANLAVEGSAISYDVFPLPVPGERRKGASHTFADPKCIGIFTTSRHPEACARFVEFMVNSKNDGLLVKKCCQLVYRRHIETSPDCAEAFSTYPVLKKFAHAVPGAHSIDQATRIMEIFDVLSMEYADCAVRGIRTPRDALTRAEARMKELME
ncbi:MAG: extracellular solute-binding protein [Candidatus Eremiobacteraeota bacterium]|nr:extracellular solute-binding protein [Candidatus Eremiobacteraeota bacterium]